MYEVFQTLDQDCDGIIRKEELMKAAELYDLDVEEKDIDLIIEEGDPLL